MNTIARQLANNLIKHNTERSEDIDIIAYSIEVLLSTAANLLLTIVFGLLVGKLKISLLFTVTFMLCRSSFGGYHAKGHLRCLIGTMLVQGVHILLIGAIPQTLCMAAILLNAAFTIPIVLVMAPKEHPNSPLSGLEKKVLRRKSRIKVVLINCLCFIAILLWQAPLILSCSYGCVAAAISIILPSQKEETP